MVRLAIVGGGPGGFFEATARLGGKILTQRFDTISAIYEAGVAELYDDSNIGVDPLKTLVQELGLKAIPMHGHAVVLGDEILRSEHEFRRCFGLPAFRALNEFHRTCAALYSSSDRPMSPSTDTTHGRIPSRFDAQKGGVREPSVECSVIF